MAFSGYSMSPKTKMEVNRENCSYILLFIPLIGALIGVIINRWGVAYPYLCNYSLLPAVVGAVIPSILSGASHLDGFFRTVDALRSHKSREEKIHILQDDAHGGYFAITACICYFMLAIGVWSEILTNGFFIVSFGYIISRSLYGLSLLFFRHAGEGKADIYVPESKASKYIQGFILLVYIAVAGGFMLAINKFVGCSCLICAFVAFLYYLLVSYKSFGGVMEEIGGFFISICEVAIPIGALIAYKWWL